MATHNLPGGTDHGAAGAAHGREERLLHHALAESRRLEALARLGGGVSRGLGDLLTVMAGHAAVLRELLRQDPAAGELADDLAQAATRAVALVRQLAAFGAEDAHAARAMAVNDVVRRALLATGAEARPDVAVRVALAPRLPLVMADAAHLELALAAVLHNALEAMPFGGRLAVVTAEAVADEAAVREAPWMRPGHVVRVTVADTGVGMEEGVRARAVEPFFTTKTHGRATGLGLSMAWGVVRQARGRLGLASVPGRGTVVTIDLPLARGPFDGAPGAHAPRARVADDATPTALDAAGVAGKPEAPREVAGADGGGNLAPANGAAAPAPVLVVERHDGVRAVMRRVLRRAGYDVLEAPDPTAGMVLAAGHGGALRALVVDHRPLSGDGARLVGRVRARHPGVPVVVTATDPASAGAPAWPAEDAAPSPVTVLRKPFTPEALVAALREAQGAAEALRAGR